MTTVVVVDDNNSLRVMKLCDIQPDAEVIGEIIGSDEDEEVVALRNPFASPCDFFWPHNVFSGERISLGELKQMYAQDDLLGQKGIG